MNQLYKQGLQERYAWNLWVCKSVICKKLFSYSSFFTSKVLWYLVLTAYLMKDRLKNIVYGEISCNEPRLRKKKQATWCITGDVFGKKRIFASVYSMYCLKNPCCSAYMYVDLNKLNSLWRRVRSGCCVSFWLMTMVTAMFHLILLY